MSGQRKTLWAPENDDGSTQPVFLYPVDQETLLRPIANETGIMKLRKGDQLVMNIQATRVCVSPWLDWLVSLLLFTEAYLFYHHSIVLHDVHHVDEYGVPRQANGEPVLI